ncbi:HEAT repeat domain-containing protein [Streptoalloteichus hindustanus]|uniref:HEAT repeat n=1 Tax=Streptoalloteichus hindustanus TaxID=2017 RepID=A0A1M5LDS7_STRHI|nr:HEAT repeat domain-containing protein [Streptoalloteichus hindustanus]SHG63136.1 HEAT repeat [Streptoalloteichus hindustanus]
MGILGRLLSPNIGKLRRAGDLPSLVAALGPPHERNVRREAAFALGELNDPRALEPLVAALEDPALDVRVAAVKALGEIPDPRAVEALPALLDSVVAERQRWVAEMSSERHQKEMRDGRRVSYDPERDAADVDLQIANLCQGVVELAARAGGPLAPHVVMRVFVDRDDLDPRCVEILHELKAVRQLVEAAQYWGDVGAVARLGEFVEDERAWRVLVESFRRGAPAPRRLSAVTALRQARHPRKAALLVTALHRELARRVAGDWLGYDSRGQELSVDVVLGLVEALGELGDPAATEPLARLLHLRDPRIAAEGRRRVVLRAVEALGHIDDPAVVDVLVGATRHEDPEVAVLGVRVLGNRGAPAPAPATATVDLLTSILASATPPVAAEAALFLRRRAQAGEPEALDALVAALSLPADHVVDAAAAALDGIPAERVTPVIMNALLGACPRSRSAITTALPLVGPTRLRPLVALVEGLAESDSAEVDPHDWIQNRVRPRLKEALCQHASELPAEDLRYFAQLPPVTTSRRGTELLEAGDDELGIPPTWARATDTADWEPVPQLAATELAGRGAGGGTVDGSLHQDVRSGSIRVD